MPDADPAALLAPIRERGLAITLEDLDRAVPAAREALEADRSNPDYFAALVAEAVLKTYHPLYRADVSRLLAAVEAALKLAAGWDRQAATLDAAADRDRSASTSQKGLLSARARERRDCAQALHADITAALGEGAENDSPPAAPVKEDEGP